MTDEARGAPPSGVSAADGAAPTDDAVWRPDVLGNDWICRDLTLPAGAVATLVRRRRTLDAGTPSKPAILYLHGFADYFFQVHVADAFEADGYPFHALDLRGYGRSIGRGTGAPGDPGDDPNYVTDLSVYAQELDAALQVMQTEGHEDVVVVAHSAGGLIASLWAHARPGRLAALVLNSPWFDLNSHWFDRVISTRAVGALGKVAPKVPVGALGQDYGRALHRTTGGEWDYDLAWKPIEGFPVRAGWLREIRRGQAHLMRGLSISCPVLVTASARTGAHQGWHAELLTTDSVLDVRHIRSRASKLGPDVTQIAVDGGAHDLALSPEPTRSVYLRTVLGWLDARLPTAVSESR